MTPVAVQGSQLMSPALTNKINSFFEGIDSEVEVKYKHLHSAVEKLKDNKARRRDFLNSQLDKLKQSGVSTLRGKSSNKFLRLNTGVQTSNVSVEETLHSFDENYLTQVMMSESLKRQFQEYQNSLASLKHTIQDLNREINQINRKKPIYDKINTIYRFQSISSTYIVGKAQKEHQRILRQRQSLENTQLELDKKQKEARTLDISMRNQIEENINTLRLRKVVTQQELSKINTFGRNSNEVATSISIVACYQGLMELFAQKEPLISDIKLQNCTKEGRPLRIYPSMPQQKVYQISKINQFEQLHSTRLSSICNLVKAIFTHLKTNEQELSLQYQQLLLVRDDKLETVEQLNQTQRLTGEQGEVAGLRQVTPRQKSTKEDPEIQTKKQQTRTRSKFWIELVQFWNSLVLKMTNICRAAQLYEVQGLPNINSDVSSFLNKHTSTQNQVHLKNNQTLFLSLLHQHFQGVLPRQTIADAFEIISMDWRSLYYLRRQSVQDTMRLPEDGFPHLALYSVIDEFLTESGNTFRSYIKQSFNVYLSCYNFLANNKHSFLLRKGLKKKKNEQTVTVRVETEQSQCQMEVKEQALIDPSSYAQQQEPKQKKMKTLGELMRMAAVPVGQLHLTKSSKQGCFF